MLRIVFGRNLVHDVDRALEREWIEANGLGGWASSTIVGANTRRYHGLLVAATRPPSQRMVLLSKLEETVVTAEGRYELGTNRYPGTVHPRGYLHLARFEREIFPVSTFEAGGVRLRKTIGAIHGENTTVVGYELLEAPGPVTLELEPLVAFRDYHALAGADDSRRGDARFEDDVLSIRPRESVPELHLAAPGASFEPSPDWFYRFQYDRERERGLDCSEDLYRHGVLRVNLLPGDRMAVVASTLDPGGRDGWDLLREEAERRRALLTRLVVRDDLAETLALAADAFLVRRGEEGISILAGYPWFTDWGRDAMIALPGLCLATGRFEDARSVLRVFLRSTSQGMLPNRFLENGEPEYTSADAALWLFVALHRYLAASGDRAFVRDEALPVLREIVGWYERGTRHGIGTGDDDLLRAGEPGVQLTWMDAKVGERMITPRQGKPVELNALWYNALCVLSRLEKAMGTLEAARSLSERARRIKERFLQVFWNEERGCLFDVVGDDGPDPSIRPNQILAIGLPFPLLPLERARQVVEVVERDLLTPVGLRSLAPGDPAYRPSYSGGQRERDEAYHQGTVWTWLLGPYVTALVRVRGTNGRGTALEIVQRLRFHLEEAGVGTVSEIFDAEAPHAPRGCVAQAWSVAEILRSWVEQIAAANRPAAPRRRASREPDGVPEPAATRPAIRRRRYRLVSPKRDDGSGSVKF